MRAEAMGMRRPPSTSSRLRAVRPRAAFLRAVPVLSLFLPLVVALLWVRIPSVLAGSPVSAAPLAPGAAVQSAAQAAPAPPAAFDAHPLLDQAQTLLDARRALEAVDLYQSVYLAAPDAATRAFALVRLADVMALYLDQKPQAAGLYDQALRDFPDCAYLANAYFNGAMLRFELGDLDRAEELFTEFRRKYPGSGRAGTARVLLRQVEKARAERAAAARAARETASRTGEPGALSASGPQAFALPHSEPVVRVLLTRSRELSATFATGCTLLPADGARRALGPGAVRVRRTRAGLAVNGVACGASAVLEPQGHGSFVLEGRTYAGELALNADGGDVLAINRVGLETYLQGVVPLEMEPDFAPQALQAQAVAARSYALAMLASAGRRAWDVTDGEGSQVYGGSGVGNVLTRMAVRSTRGVVLMLDRRPLPAFYHSHSGGRLEDDAQVWSSDLPVYRVREDKPSLVAKPMRWEYEISGPELARRLRAKGFGVRRVDDVSSGATSPSGRLLTVSLSTDAGDLALRASTLRLIVGGHSMKSTLCRFSKTGKGFRITGQGFGHGVGMSQWGAQAMAAHGRTFRRILAFYYPGAGLEKYY
jgi:stage II sporulation protein D